MLTVMYYLPSGWWSAGTFPAAQAIAIAFSEQARTDLPHKVCP
jgi:hypothetical protein